MIMFSILEKIIEKLDVGFLNRADSPSSVVEQRNSSGDNVGRDKNVYYSSGLEQKKDLYPEITFHIIGPFRNGGAGLELYNSGTEDVKDIDIILSWHQDTESQKQERGMSQLRFIGENDDPIMTHASASLTILRKEEKKIALGIPNITVRQKVAVRVKCRGLRSGISFNEKQILKTIREYPNHER